MNYVVDNNKSEKEELFKTLSLRSAIDGNGKKEKGEYECKSYDKTKMKPQDCHEQKGFKAPSRTCPLARTLIMTMTTVRFF